SGKRQAMIETQLCREVDETMGDVLEGVARDALFDHIAGCERCRDARHDAEQQVQTARDAALDYQFPEGLAARLLASLPEPASAPSEAAAAPAALARREPQPEPPRERTDAALKIADAPAAQRQGQPGTVARSVGLQGLGLRSVGLRSVGLRLLA